MKTLGKILLTCAAITTSSLLLLGCPPKEEQGQSKNTIAKIVNEYTDNDASKRAMDAYNEMMRSMTGNVVKEEQKSSLPSTQLAPKTDKVLVEPKEVVREFPRPPKNLEDYFFKGEELNGLELVTEIDYGISPASASGDYTSQDISAFNGRLLSPKELAELKQKMSDLRIDADSLINQGITLYKIGTNEHPIYLEHSISEFDSELGKWEFLTAIAQQYDGALLFVNKNISSIINVDTRQLNIKQEKTLVNSLIKYEKRTLGDFYLGSSDLSWHTLDETYRKLGISQSESGFYFRQAMEFQRGLYDLSEEELRKIIDKEFNLTEFENKIRKYKNRKIERDELEKEVLSMGKNIERKFFFTFPSIEHVLFYGSLNLAQAARYSFNSEEHMEYFIDEWSK